MELEEMELEETELEEMELEEAELEEAERTETTGSARRHGASERGIEKADGVKSRIARLETRSSPHTRCKGRVRNFVCGA